MQEFLIRSLTSLFPVKKMRRFLREQLINYFLGPDFIKSKQYLPFINTKKIELESNLSIKNLFLGSSHVEYGCDPEYISSTTFNMGSRSQDIVTSFLIYQYFRDKLPHLENVVIGISLFSAGHTLSKTSESFLCNIYNIVYGFKYDSFSEYRKSRALLKYLNKKTINYNGFHKYQKAMSNDESSLLTRVDSHLRNNERTPDNIHILKSHIEMIQNDFRHAVLVYMPVHPKYRERAIQLSGKTSDELFHKTTALADSLSVPIIDLFSSTLFSAEDFHDFDHLNLEGAKKFSLIMKKYLMERPCSAL